MTRRLSAWVVALGMAANLPAVAQELRAGADRVDITPPVGLPMWGYGARHDKPNIGVLDPLFADAVVIELGAARIGIVGLDLGRAPMRKSFESIRQRCKAEARIDTLFLVGSHTHHGPVLEIAASSPAVAAYTKTLEDKLVGVLKSAADKLRPARFCAAKATLAMNRNRHSKLPEKPVDRELVVVRFVDAEDHSIATLVNFAAHPTTIEAANLRYSPDYPGALKEKVRQALGGECLFLQGASGDLSTDRGTAKDYREFGQRLGAEVVQLSKKAVPAAPKKPTLAVREERFRFEPLRINLKNPLVRKLFADAFFPALVDAFTAEYADGSQPLLTVALLSDELGIVGVSGEFFCNHALRLKERARLPTLLFLGYCNDYHQYFPTIEAVAEGGYGADAAVSPVPIGAGETMMTRALFHLYDLRGKFNRMPF